RLSLCTDCRNCERVGSFRTLVKRSAGGQPRKCLPLVSPAKFDNHSNRRTLKRLGKMTVFIFHGSLKARRMQNVMALRNIKPIMQVLSLAAIVVRAGFAQDTPQPGSSGYHLVKTIA